MLFVIDFDGTVAPSDTTDALLERFADPEWRRIEEQWVRGEIGSRQCMAAQIALVEGDDDALEDFLRSVQIDPQFAEFVEYVKDFAELAIVSDGLDYPIVHAVRDLDIAVYANRLSFRRRGLSLSFPHGDPACGAGSGVCKCAIARAAGNGPVVLIGDGRSDFCIARSAGYVFAKGSLRRFCEAEQINHSPFETFGDVLSVVRVWKAQQESECPLPG